MNEHRITRTDEEINTVCEDAQRMVDEGLTRFPDRSYEEGLLAGIDWVVGDTDNHPYPEE